MIPDAADLTGILRRSGVITTAAVRDVSVISDRPTLISRIIRLRLVYDEPPPDAPATIILKLRHGSFTVPRAGLHEVEFYTRIAPMLPHGVVPRCFDAHHDDQTNDWHLLLEDLTTSHAIATRWPLPPARPQCQAILTALARHHAAWWDDPRLGASVGAWASPDAIAQRLDTSVQHFKAFADRLGEDLPPTRRKLYERLFDATPSLMQRYHSHRNMTIAHGDAHVWNFFLPRDDRHGVRIFDWDSWRLGLATSDLAHMMALHWYPDRRARMEQAMLDHYYTALLDHGVTGHDRVDLAQDYRWSVLQQLTTPVWQAAHDIPPAVWWGHLQRILAAVDDLGCQDLL